MDVSWTSLRSSVDPAILQTIEELGFTSMTPVQAACIPAMLNYKDVAAEAVTGSGKTLSFLVPTLQILLRRESEWKKHEVGAIIIAPTRELAFQINEVLAKFLKKTPSLSQILFIGGTSIQVDIENFTKKGPNIIIATPGRLEDLMLRNNSRFLTSLKFLEVLILDEADCLLNLGFEKSINTILQMLPKQRRTGLFSATQTTEVTKLVRAGLRNPVSVMVKDNNLDAKNYGKRAPEGLENYYCFVEPQDKLKTLLDFIKKQKDQKILVFFSTCACVDYFAFILTRLVKNATVLSIHGKMKEKTRFTIFDKFRSLNTGVLCCTDVMARGIDITRKIHWVIQFDPPSNPSSFVHRAGRTARIGNEGNAVLFLQPSESDYVKFIQLNQKVVLNVLEMPKSETSSTALLNKLRQFQLKDRGIYDKAMRAFVSYYKAYSKYKCSLILRTKDLQLGRVADCFGLLKFPKMAELYGKKPQDFQDSNCDLNAIEYKDKLREKYRKRKLEEFEKTGQWPEKRSNDKNKKRRMKETSSWSKTKESKEKPKIKKTTRKNNKALGTVQVSQ